jgi:hypothetical protein
MNLPAPQNAVLPGRGAPGLLPTAQPTMPSAEPVSRPGNVPVPVMPALITPGGK